MQNWLVKTILLILTVLSLDTTAANQCVDLFSKATRFSNISFEEQSQYKELQNVADSVSLKIKALYAFSEKNEKSEQLVKALNSELNEKYVNLVRNFLQQKNIEYQMIRINDGPEEHLRDIQYPIFMISPVDKKSKLNKYALGLNKVAGVSLIYSPPFNRANGFASAFIPSMNAIVLHENAILDGQFSDSRITPHEIKHALFYAELKGEYESKIKAPIFGFYKSTKIVDSNTKKPYQSFLSFEELVTYAYSITADAKKIKREGSLADRSTLVSSLKIMKSISERSAEFAQTSIMYIERLPHWITDYDNSFTVRLSDDSQVVLQIPEADLLTYQKNPFEYAKKEFEKIQKLAEFNLAQIQKINLDGDMTAALNFRTDQIKILLDKTAHSL